MASGDVWVVVPAAGHGTRMGGDRKKQFRLLGGQPVLVRTLEALAASVDGIVVAVGEAETASVQTMLSQTPSLVETPVHVVVGGATRQASVARGLQAVPGGVPVVLVHDAVRPFVRPEAVQAVADAVAARGAAALAVPVADTLRRGGGDAFGQTVEREGLWRMQTPQGARREFLVAALEQAERDGLEATDEVGALSHAGHEVAIVDGDERNIKLTRPADWALGLAIWASGVGGQQG